MRARTPEFVTLLLAAGAGPDTCLMIAQSYVPEHTELHYLLECTTGYGEAQRMIQFREKPRRQGHVRDIATRFDTRYGPTFTVPRAVNPPVAARIMDLAAPTTKMSKSAPSVAGSLRMLDEPQALRRTVMRAVTDTDDDVSYDPIRKPGVSNLLTVLAACTGDEPTWLAGQFDRYGELKAAVADAVVATLDPIRERYRELARDPAHVRTVLRHGARRASEQAREKVCAARCAIGLLPPAF